jgi:outer membrane protein insertion porin family
MLFGLLGQQAYAVDNSFLIKEINIEGNHRIESDTIEIYMNISQGKSITDQSLSDSIKALYKTNLFSNIDIKHNKGVLNVKVEENPLVNKVIFKGNSKLGDDALKKEIKLQERAVYTKAQLRKDVMRITEVYQRTGRVDIKVVPKVIILKQNRVDLLFKIEEGKTSRIRKITFVGNKNYRANILKEVINSREKTWYRFSSTSFDPDRMAFDKELLRRYYMERGYADFEMNSALAELLPEINSFILTYNLKEGEKYHFGDYKIKSEYQTEEIKQLGQFVKIKKGELFNIKLLDDTVDEMLNFLNDKGFAFVDVEYEIVKDRTNQITDIIFKVRKNSRIFINHINIKGNSRTYDKVIRREFRLLEGDPFNATKLKRSQQRIKNLGFFDKVDFKRNRTDNPSLIDIDVEVAEKATGELNFGFGYSTTEKFLGNVSVKERNLLGKAHTVFLSAQKSSRSDQIDFSYQIPYFMNRDLTFGFNVFSVRSDNRESLSDIFSTGFGVSIAYSLSEYLSHTVDYSYSINKVSNIDASASNFIQEQAGERSVSAVGEAFIYDKRDDRLNPSDGYYGKLSHKLAGVGGDTKTIQHDISLLNYTPFFDKNLVIKISAKGGYITGLEGQKVRIDQRYFLGGSSFRGFANAGIGPRDQNGSSLGAKAFYKATTEINFPLGLPDELGFKGMVFASAGSLTLLDDHSADIRDSGSIRTSIGTGVNWTSPLGPISFSFSKAIDREDYDRTETFRISFGTRF